VSTTIFTAATVFARAILFLIGGWFIVSRILIALLKTPRDERAALASANSSEELP
jgi:hypothetical protein